MSENEKKNNANSFSVPAKKPTVKKTTTAKPKATTTKSVTKSTTTAKPKTPTAKPKVADTKPKTTSIKPKTTAKPKATTEVKATTKSTSTTKPKIAKAETQNTNPDLSLLTSEERIRVLSGKKVKEEKKVEAVKEDRIPIEKIKKVHTEKSKTTTAFIPEVGHRNKKNNTMNILVYIALFLVIAIISLLIINLLKERRDKDVVVIACPATPIDEEYIEIEIKSGQSATNVANLFSSIVDKDSLLSYLVDNNIANTIQTGTYIIHKDDFTIERIASIITTKTLSNKQFNLYAGYTIDEIDEALTLREFIKGGEFISESFILQKERNLTFREGWLLAGVYSFSDVDSLIKEMNQRMIDLIKEESLAIQESGLSIDEIIIIASMINRETQDKEQMKTIAAIILNRYFQSMPLGIDATTRYELNNWTGKIEQEVYEKDTPYNTRRKPGLPPSGIGSPSIDAILAVLYPENTDALYYLHSNDGKLYTSLTYTEHLQNYEKYGKK